METNDRCLQSALGDLVKNKKERHQNFVRIFYYWHVQGGYYLHDFWV